MSGDMLVLKGEKRQEKEEKDKNYHFSERAYGAFQGRSSCRAASIVTRSPQIFGNGF
jgi:HSP20 family protein